jgi:hypothetical protein
VPRLLARQPVPKDAGLPDPGPVFIHTDACTPFADAALPADLVALPLFLEGYREASWLVRRERVVDGDVEAAASKLFAAPAIDDLQLRNAEAGCFIARAERIQPAVGMSSTEK